MLRCDHSRELPFIAANDNGVGILSGFAGAAPQLDPRILNARRHCLGIPGGVAVAFGVHSLLQLQLKGSDR